jgi:uncharacterized protein
MIAALARAGQVLDEPDYTRAATRAAQFILRKMTTPDGRLLHRWRDGVAAIPASVDDYAFLIWGLIELYEASFDAEWLKTALALQRDMLAWFWDRHGGAFFFTPDDGERLLVRPKEAHDGATPSGNSVAMLNLLRLGRMTTKTEWEVNAAAIGRTFSGQVGQMPSAFTQLLVAVDFGLGPSQEVVIAGDPRAEDTRALLRALRGRFLPNTVVVLRPTGADQPLITRLAPFTQYQQSLDSRATAYVCHNYRCEQPTADIAEMLQLLSGT